MAWTLAHNLQVRSDEVHAVYPKLTVYSVGDLEHQAECSDHNPDARGIVHAIDIMAAAGSAEAEFILPWLLSWHDDLQYIIHNGRIWGVNNGGFSGPGQRYTGSDQHTDHIHVSGLHGTTGKNAATCTGYSTSAEAMTPPPLEEDPLAGLTLDQIAQATAQAIVDKKLGRSDVTVGQALQDTNTRVVAVLAAQDPVKLADALKAEGLNIDVDPASLQTAFLNALKTLAATGDTAG